MVWTPPQHAKSTLTTRLTPPLVLGQDPSSKLLLLSYSADVVHGHSLAARAALEAHGKRVCRGVALNRDRASKGHWETTAGGYVRACSIQGSVTGHSANGIVIDDPFKGSEDSGSLTIRDKVWNTYMAAVETRLSPDGWVAIINTPWHPDDLCGRLLESEPDKWLVLRYPAMSEGPGDPVNRPLDRGLWTARYPQHWYADRRATYEAAGKSHVWDALYQCRPLGDGSLRAFPDSYFDRRTIYVPRPERHALRVLAIDPSKSKTGRQGDYAAYCDLTYHDDRHAYADVHLHREPLTALYARAVELVRSARQAGCPYNMVLIEVNQWQEAVAEHLQHHLQLSGLPDTVHRHTTPSDQGKNARIQVDLEPLLAQGRLHWVSESSGNRLCVQQLREIPNGAHDDGPDAVSMATQAVNLLLTGTKRPHNPVVIRTR